MFFFCVCLFSSPPPSSSIIIMIIIMNVIVFIHTCSFVPSHGSIFLINTTSSEIKGSRPTDGMCV